MLREFFKRRRGENEERKNEGDREMLFDELHRLVEEMVEVQQRQLLEVGRRIVPSLTPEDMLQPNDYPELENHPCFRYEEGLLAGMQTVQNGPASLGKRWRDLPSGSLYTQSSLIQVAE